MQVLIIDSATDSADDLCRQLKEIIGTEHEIQRFGSGAQALFDVRAEKLHPDVAFIDLNVKDAPAKMESVNGTLPTGIRTACLLLRESPGIQIIFVADTPDGWLRAYEADHAWFLQRPISLELLRKAWDRAMVRIGNWDRKCFTCEFNRTVYRIPFSEILYFENNSRRITMHTVGRKEYSFYGIMGDVMKQLDNHFVRCHNSYIVNLDRVDIFNRAAFTVDRHKIPISRRYAGEAQEAFFHICNIKR